MVHEQGRPDDIEDPQADPRPLAQAHRHREPAGAERRDGHDDAVGHRDRGVHDRREPPPEHEGQQQHDRADGQGPRQRGDGDEAIGLCCGGQGDGWHRLSFVYGRHGRGWRSSGSGPSARERKPHGHGGGWHDRGAAPGAARAGARRAAPPDRRRRLPPGGAADRGPAGGRLRGVPQPGARGAARSSRPTAVRRDPAPPGRGRRDPGRVDRGRPVRRPRRSLETAGRPDWPPSGPPPTDVADLRALLDAGPRRDRRGRPSPWSPS